MSAHTPGPWRVTEYGERAIHADDNTKIALPEVWQAGDTEEAEANARLIAAAPDLLGHLQTLAAIIDRVDSGDIKDWADVGAKFYHGRDAIRAAIAKATQG